LKQHDADLTGLPQLPKLKLAHRMAKGGGRISPFRLNALARSFD
jgi:hypothetical protein